MQPTRILWGEAPCRPCEQRGIPIRPCSGWGLPCGRCYQNPGALLPHPFSLAAESPRLAVFSLWHFPYAHVRRHRHGGRYPPPLLRGARTFLERFHARGCPAPWRPCSSRFAPSCQTSMLRHCEERSDEAIHGVLRAARLAHGLPRRLRRLAMTKKRARVVLTASAPHPGPAEAGTGSRGFRRRSRRRSCAGASGAGTLRPPWTRR